MQLFQEVTRALMQSMPAPQSGAAFAETLMQDLKSANFTDVTCTSFSHPLEFDTSDLVTFTVGPHGVFAAMLKKLAAAGRTGVPEEAQQVSHSSLAPL